MSAASQFGIESLREDGRTTIKLTGELDSATSPLLTAEFELAVTALALDELVIDMEGLSFIDSAGLRALIQIEHAARDRAFALTVERPAPEVTELLETTGIAARLTLGPQHAGPRRREFVERIELALARDQSAPARARQEIRQAVASRLGPHDAASATLLTSELVTNAVIHPAPRNKGAIGLRITTFEDGLLVEVTDDGPGFDPGAPRPRRPERGGRGLLLVDRLASRWGTVRVPGDASERFCVWFELCASDAETRLVALEG
jgi:anti-anti-sigma factor